jgi:hypothetical protein
LADVEKEISRLVDAVTKGVDPALLVTKQAELKECRERAAEQLGEIQQRLASMPDAETVRHQSLAIRLQLLEHVQRRDWRKLRFEEVRRYLTFIFGDHPGKSGDGILVMKDRGHWRISFKGRFHAFGGEYFIDGRRRSFAVAEFAQAWNKRVLRFFAH